MLRARWNDREAIDQAKHLASAATIPLLVIVLRPVDVSLTLTTLAIWATAYYVTLKIAILMLSLILHLSTPLWGRWRANCIAQVATCGTIVLFGFRFYWQGEWYLLQCLVISGVAGAMHGLADANFLSPGARRR